MIPDDEQEFALRMERATARAVAAVNGIDRAQLEVTMQPADEKWPGGWFSVNYIAPIDPRLFAHFMKVFTAEYCAEFELTPDPEQTEEDDADWWKR